MKRKPVRETAKTVWRSTANELDRRLEPVYAKLLKQVSVVGFFSLADGTRDVSKERWDKFVHNHDSHLLRLVALPRHHSTRTSFSLTPQCKQNQFQTTCSALHHFQCLKTYLAIDITLWAPAVNF